MRASGAPNRDGHTGLWYTKFFDQVDPDLGTILKPSHDDPEVGKKKWVSKLDGKRVGDRALLKEHQERRSRMIQALGGEEIPLTLTSPFVSGLGYEHAVQNGFLWHHSLSVPYLPGSTVKGAVRAWLQQSGSLDASVSVLFGDAMAGALEFFDALPTHDKPVMLGVDVVTPHDSGWKVEDAKNAPSDWLSPIPAAFLMVNPGCVFNFAVVSREGRKEVATNILSVLEEALEWQGIGAKVNVGYGRFQRPDRVDAWRPAVGDYVQHIESRERVRVVQVSGKRASVQFVDDDDGIEEVNLDALKQLA